MPLAINRGELDYHLIRPVSPLFMLSLRDFAANPGAWADGYLAALGETGQLRAEEVPPGATDDPRLTGQVRAAAAGLLAMDAGAGTLGSGEFSGFFDSVRRWLGETPDAYGSGTVLPKPPYRKRPAASSWRRLGVSSRRP